MLVDAARRAAEPMGVDETPLWLPPLPTSARLSLLPSSDPGQVAVGVVDLPDEQRQPPLRLSTDSAAPLLLVGTARSGRTTAATTVVTALAGAHSPDGLHVYVIDSGRALTRLSSLPHTGAVVDAGDVDRVERMLLFLTSQVQSRRGDAGTDRARLLLVVDSWDGLLATAGDADAARLQELLLRLIADGPGAGLRVVVTSDRSGIMGKLASSIADRICLRLADPGDYAAIGLPARQAPRDLAPGRGIRAADLAYVQLATPDDESWAKALHWPSPRHHAPRRFDPLPVRVPLHEVRRHAAAGVVIGVRGDDLAPVVVDPASAAGTFLVAGPPRSGRSTALLNIATQLQPRRVVALCGRRGSALRPRADLAAIRDASIPADVVAAVEAAAQGATLLVDDVDLIDDIVALTQLEDAVRRARDGAGFVVLAGTTEAMTVAFRGPVAQARRGRAGLLLRPEGSHDGELLGLRLRRRSAHADPPGRGLLAVDGAVVPVQVPDPT